MLPEQQQFSNFASHTWLKLDWHVDLCAFEVAISEQNEMEKDLVD